MRWMRSWSVPLLLAAAFAASSVLREQRIHEGLAQTALAPSPGGRAAGVALLGGFRGLYVDYLWCRVEGQLMQPRPPLHEIPGTYRLIGQLQPHYPELWAYTAFRLALDVAVAVPERSAESDFLWALRGIDHLQEGIRLNPGNAKLTFSLAELYHRRCTPNWTIPHGDYARRRLLKDRGEDAYDRAVSLIHEIREDPEVLPGWLGKSAHVRFSQAVEASTPGEEDFHLAQAIEEHSWIIRLYEDPAPENRWLRERPGFYHEQAARLRDEILVNLGRQRAALRLEASGDRARAAPVWAGLMRNALLHTLKPEPLAEKHLRAIGILGRTYATLADEFQLMTFPEDPAARERLDLLVRILRQEAGRLGEAGDA